MNSYPSAVSRASPTGLRSLVWEGTIPLCITIEPSELPAGADRGIEAYYASAPRLSYLPMLLPAVKSNLLALALDESSWIALKDANMWFEHAASGTPLRWHWPVGLLHDALKATYPPPSLDLPLQITLHLSPPPIDKMLLQNNLATCRDAFMNQVKEADFVRWGSTRRVTNLRQREAESLWEGLQEHDFEKFWSVASKLVPVPPPTHGPGSAALSPSLPPVSVMDRMPDGNGVRHVPTRVYLPHGAPVLQANVAPVTPDGKPTTLLTALNTIAPLLFPLSPAKKLAKPLLHGAPAPLDAELGWLGTVMCGADGWLSIVVQLER